MEFKLRPWTIADLDSLVKHANNPKIANNMTDGFPHPYTKASGEKFIAYATTGPVHFFAIEANGEAVGGIGFQQQTDIHRRNAELGYWLGEEYWGKKIISRAIREVVAIAFKNEDIKRVFARPFNTNLASQHVLLKNGFTLEAVLPKTLIKNGEILDEMIFAIRR